MSKFKSITCESDHKWENKAICPHCGYIHQDSWEMNDGEEGEFNFNCEHCDKEFGVERHVCIEYSTSKEPVEDL